MEWEGFASRPSGGRLKGTDASAVDPSLARFQGETGDSDAFIILSTGPQTFLQAARRSSGFVLEYQQGDTDQHFECTDNVTPRLIEALFHLYLDNPAKIAILVTWQKIDV